MHHVEPRPYAQPILAGLLVVAAGLLPWMGLAALNLRHRPDLAWAAAASLFYMGVLLLWLRRRLPSRIAAEEGALPTGVTVLLLVLLYGVWTAISRLSPVPDLGEYPTTAYRWSMLLMGGLTAGVIEEVAFRGVMQGGIERFDRANAIWITSLIFVASHITQGVGAVLTLGPGLFIASMLYGSLARSTGSILPGIVLHVVGDLMRVYFGVLRGHGSLLFVP